MDLTYSVEQTMLRDSAQRFLDERYPFAHRQAIVATELGYDPQIWRHFAELGWLGMPFSEDDGGFGGGPVETAILMEAFGRSLVVEPWLAAVVLGGQLIVRHGAAAHKRSLLPPLIAGEAFPVLAHIERAAGYDLAHVATTARRSGAGYVLSGAKTHVLGATGAGHFLVTARSGGDARAPAGLSVFVVPRGTPGLLIRPYRLIDETRAADLVLDNVSVGSEALLVEGLTVEALEDLVDIANAALAADAVGAMTALLANTVSFTKERVQFGKPLSQFQALRHRLAEMAIKCEEARASALLATLSLDGPRNFRIRCVSGARAKIGRVSRHVAQEAIQLHGAMGISEEMPIGRWFKRLFVFENTFGSTAFHLQRYRAVMMTPDVMSQGLLQPAAKV